jgi:hypothetical protein
MKASGLGGGRRTSIKKCCRSNRPLLFFLLFSMVDCLPALTTFHVAGPAHFAKKRGCVRSRRRNGNTPSFAKTQGKKGHITVMDRRKEKLSLRDVIYEREGDAV